MKISKGENNNNNKDERKVYPSTIPKTVKGKSIDSDPPNFFCKPEIPKDTDLHIQGSSFP